MTEWGQEPCSVQSEQMPEDAFTACRSGSSRQNTSHRLDSERGLCSHRPGDRLLQSPLQCYRESRGSVSAADIITNLLMVLGTIFQLGYVTIQGRKGHGKTCLGFRQIFSFSGCTAAYGGSRGRGSNQSCSCQPTPQPQQQDLSHICNLYHSSRQHQTLNPLSEARD